MASGSPPTSWQIFSRAAFSASVSCPSSPTSSSSSAPSWPPSLAPTSVCRTRRAPSLEKQRIVDQLEAKGVLRDAGLLVLSILGWQSMIYLPELNSHPPSTLAIQHDTGGPDSGFVYDRYVMIDAFEAADMCDRPLWVFIKWFGNLLPARPTEADVAGAADVAIVRGKTAASWTALYPDQLNAHLLHTLLRVRFRWVDSLALHLDYDKSTRTLSLFAFPSMCVAHLRGRSARGSNSETDIENNEPPAGGAIFAFSNLEHERYDPRANEADIAHFLQEVLMSYRLLFGQSAKARRLFRDVYAPAVAPSDQPDTLLVRLCGRAKGPSDPSGLSGLSSSTCCPGLVELPPDRSIYYAARDFPVLYRRVQLLADELSSAKPTSIRDLLNDRRDTLQFWTFWLVSVFGGISILLALVQTALVAVQIAQAAGKI